jgi:hypothetical protein
VSAIVQTTTWLTTNANATRPTLESKQDPIKNAKLVYLMIISLEIDTNKSEIIYHKFVNVVVLATF